MAARRPRIVPTVALARVHAPVPRLAWLHEEARSSVLTPAPLARLGALRPLLTVAEDGDATRIDAPRDEVVHSGLSPLFPQIHVELVLPSRGAPTVAVPLDQDEVVLVGAQPRGVRIKDGHVCRSDRRFAE